MKEHIYTIPLNDIFSENDGCPFCRLLSDIQKNEIDRITGAAMMEPNIRVETNRHGFCFKHFEMIANNGKRHPTALIIQSHLEEITTNIKNKKGASLLKYLDEINRDCYICGRINDIKDSLFKNFFYIYKNDDNFVKKYNSQTELCFPHAAELLKYAESELSKKEFVKFSEEAAGKIIEELSELQGDIDWFCKKFDYRFKDEDWKNSKDSIERTIKTLTGKTPGKKFQS